MLTRTTAPPSGRAFSGSGWRQVRWPRRLCSSLGAVLLLAPSEGASRAGRGHARSGSWPVCLQCAGEERGRAPACGHRRTDTRMCVLLCQEGTDRTLRRPLTAKVRGVGACAALRATPVPSRSSKLFHFISSKYPHWSNRIGCKMFRLGKAQQNGGPHPTPSPRANSAVS